MMFLALEMMPSSVCPSFPCSNCSTLQWEAMRRPDRWLSVLFAQRVVNGVLSLLFAGHLQRCLDAFFLQLDSKRLRRLQTYSSMTPITKGFFLGCRLKVKSGSIQHYQHFLHASLNGYFTQASCTKIWWWFFFSYIDSLIAVKFIFSSLFPSSLCVTRL